MKKPDLTMQQAHNYCTTYEASELQKCKFNNLLGVTGNEVFALNSRGENTSHECDVDQEKMLCKFCGYKHLFSHPARCPAFKKYGRNCNKLGHFARMCSEKKVKIEKQSNNV